MSLIAPNRTSYIPEDLTAPEIQATDKGALLASNRIKMVLSRAYAEYRNEISLVETMYSDLSGSVRSGIYVVDSPKEHHTSPKDAISHSSITFEITERLLVAR